MQSDQHRPSVRTRRNSLDLVSRYLLGSAKALDGQRLTGRLFCTASRLRPLARLSFSTRRPPLVDMRALKP